MVTHVLDASAVLRLLLAEAGAGRVREILTLSLRGSAKATTSAVNWGEVVGKIFKAHGEQAADQLLDRFEPLGLVIVPATTERATRAALISSTHKIPYADAFGVELTQDSPDHVLVTADFDVKPAEGSIRIEFLPNKPTS
jgi:predicted nucleic acid-binding protein